MALIEECIASRLLDQSGLTSLVSTRIRPVAKAQSDELPFVLFEKTGTEEINTHSDACEYQRAYMQIDCFGATKASALAVSKAIRNALHHKQFTAGGIFVACSFCEDTNDATPQTQPGEETPVYVLSSNYKILFREV